jgi:hypothetical protein
MNAGNGLGSGKWGIKRKTGSVSQKMAERPGEFMNECNVGSRRTPIQISTEPGSKTVKKLKDHSAANPLFGRNGRNKSYLLIFVK